ncbi:glycerol-3-phosphate 1-O-acyltransferase PlsY [Alterisphingorhabdus coralli]|uniref:Glycerol-3-phosphate acyltransferase n=1 Tax=Alterisphingorhabdus coralli TaxID=3071408 RepID=A0AA97F494_9SPHN|nr:glycerol-3-phosphate 1-O-acyltransferase PlsY [Parasphingorhabdus sp. SCSIO 66989]WOE73991.1 glycerol-3-phosphate 1-O-acyltransferase PlsY [Parasphingorhabdus sp. SCSIO 66989]
MLENSAIWLAALLGYAMGSIPFGMVLTRLAGAGDLRSIGSGNIGATNVLRTGRKGLAAATLLLDLAKGAVPVMIAHALWPDSNGAIAAGAGAFIGHLYPVWLGFKGGKGVATLMGVCLGLSWMIGLAYAVVWLGTLALSRYSSLSGMLAAIVAPVVAITFSFPNYAMLLAGCAALVVWRHRDNIGRLIKGEEPKVGQGKKAQS